MSTTHLIAINGDYLDRIVDDPTTFANIVHELCARSGKAHHEVKTVARSHFGTDYVVESMNGLDGAIENAWSLYFL